MQYFEVPANLNLIRKALDIENMKYLWYFWIISYLKVSEYNSLIIQSHTADQPTAPWRRDTEH